jgi:aminoglycoside phosphotransferase (APT) family kinase protein
MVKLIDNANESFTQTDEATLRQCLERTAPDVFGEPAAIAEIQRTKFHSCTSYDAYVVTVRLVSGAEVLLFHKDFGLSLRPKDGAKQRREREVFVYRNLLVDAGLGTPRYYGSVMDEAEGRVWLLLEYVDGTPVGYTEPGPGWEPAANALGRLHGYFAPQLDRLRGCDYLIQHNVDFLWATVEQALRSLTQIAPDMVGRLESLVARYDPVVALMANQPTTLLQGGSRGSNILIRVANDPSRVCILDWEQAALGPGLFDLAHLVDGIGPPLLDRLLDAYRSGAAEYGMSLPPDADVKHAVDCFRLHMVLNLLARSVLKRYTVQDMVKLLDYGDSISSIVLDRAPKSSSRLVTAGP